MGNGLMAIGLGGLIALLGLFTVGAVRGAQAGTDSWWYAGGIMLWELGLGLLLARFWIPSILWPLATGCVVVGLGVAVVAVLTRKS